MRLSELAQETSVAPSTLKYYLRLSLLTPGEARNARESSYGPEHVARVKLIRALSEVVRMPLDKIQEVVAVLDQTSAEQDGDELLPVFGKALRALPPYLDDKHRVDNPHRPDEQPRRPLAEDLLTKFGLSDAAEVPGAGQLEAALRAAHDAGLPLLEEQAEVYVEAARLLARADLAPIDQLPVRDALAYAVVGTALYENVFAALRRVAHYELFLTKAERLRPPPRP